MNINQQTSASLLESLNLNPILATAGGFIADMSDEQYFSIPAHSKHQLEPALKSGKDFEYKQDPENRKPASEQSDAIKDGTLLHCLTLEKAEFKKRYFIQTDFDKMHQDNPFYFTNSDSLKKFIVQHNEQHKEIANDVASQVTQFNSKQVAEVDESISFDDLPKEYRVGEISKRNIKKCINDFISTFLKPIDTSLSDDTEFNVPVTERYTLFKDNMAHWISGDFSKKWNDASTFRDKARILNKVITEQDIKFHALEENDQVEKLPSMLKTPYFTATSKKQAVKKYVMAQKDETFQIDSKSSMVDQIKTLKQMGSIDIDVAPHLINKLPNLGNKKESGVWEVSDVLAVITAAYKKPVLFRKHLESAELERAESEKKITITSDQYVHAQRIVEAVYADEDARKWLTAEGNIFEVAMFWNHPIFGDLCKGKSDIMNLNFNVITDIKFVRTVDFDRLERDSAAMNFHLQNSMYENGFNEIGKHDADDGVENKLNKFIFIVVEKDAPKLGASHTKPVRVRVIEFIDREDIDRASELLDGAIGRIHKWFEMGEFEGFKGIKGVRVPVYQRKYENTLIEEIQIELQQWKEEKDKLGIEPLTDMSEQRPSDKVEKPDINNTVTPVVAKPLPNPDQLFNGASL
ncbi:PD-(D/E)XK nuclease-like domain-containing protein [Vibrio sp. R78045]|uniref:PD-(D/E)XK nuclease-like domain-containing protein n=1 Tax=Vibrio sp. R78045 TaxID=3093868 RepID=UPI0036F1FF6E